MFESKRSDDRIMFYLLGCGAILAGMVVGFWGAIVVGVIAAVIDYNKD